MHTSEELFAGLERMYPRGPGLGRVPGVRHPRHGRHAGPPRASTSTPGGVGEVRREVGGDPVDRLCQPDEARGAAQHGPHAGGDDRRGHAFTHHVGDRHLHLVADEEVVEEVARHVAGGYAAARDLVARHDRRCLRQQRALHLEGPLQPLVGRQLLLHPVGEVAQEVDVGVGEAARPRVEQAQHAESVAARADEGLPRVEADAGPAVTRGFIRNRGSTRVSGTPSASSASRVARQNTSPPLPSWRSMPELAVNQRSARRTAVGRAARRGRTGPPAACPRSPARAGPGPVRP